MSPRHFLLTYLRYLRARLWNLRQPSVWGTAIFLLVAGVVIREYWLHPDILTKWQDPPPVVERPAESSLSDEEKALGADIDNLPVLLNDVEKANLGNVPINLPQEPQVNQNKNSENDVIIKPNATPGDTKPNSSVGIVNNASPIYKNPFILQAENSLKYGTNKGNQFLDINSFNPSSRTTNSSHVEPGLTSKTIDNESTVLANPLQTAIEQSGNQKSASSNNTTLNPINSFGSARQIPPSNNLPTNTGMSYTQPTVTSQGQNPYTNYNSGQTLPSNSLPANTGANYAQPAVTSQGQNPYTNYNSGQTLPNAGISTNGIAPIVPAASNNGAPYGVQSSTQSITNNTAPVGYANYGNYGVQPPNQLLQPTYGNSSSQSNPPVQSNSANSNPYSQFRRRY